MEKFGSRLCVAQTLTIPKEGKMTVHQGDFSEKSITLKPGKGQSIIHVDPSASENNIKIKVIKDQRLSWMNLC